MIGQIIKGSANVASILAIVFLAFATSDSYSQTQKKGKTNPTRTQVLPAACETTLKQLQGEVVELRRQLSLQQAEKAAPSSGNGSVEIEAALVFQSRDVKPVVRETFYLLKENPESLILTKENYELAKREAAKQEFTKNKIASKFEEWNLKQASFYNEFFPEYRAAILKMLKEKAVAVAETGFDGKVRIDSLPGGNYYLFGVYHYGEGGVEYGIYLPKAVIWNLPITVKPGTNKIILDNKNTL